ncbi:hypothetical protein [Azotobacter chroococcum]|uniref:hypothetical protein n=1 Tax=Azotobacter chroococcum TaxID=353 RepID=UPI0012FDC62F|nr:hypothetical protein [Azotobacter chroococcum]
MSLSVFRNGAGCTRPTGLIGLVGGNDFPVYMTAKAESEAKELAEKNIQERTHKEIETGWTYDMSMQERKLIKVSLYRDRNCTLIGRKSK